MTERGERERFVGGGVGAAQRKTETQRQTEKDRDWAYLCAVLLGGFRGGFGLLQRFVHSYNHTVSETIIEGQVLRLLR